MVKYDEQEAPGVRVIRIDLDGRYLVVLTAPELIAAEELSRTYAALHQWWESGGKFLVLGLRSGVSIRLERVDAPE